MKRSKKTTLSVKREKESYRNPVSDFWANHKPRRDFGTYANEIMHSYKHNGLVAYQ